MIDHWEGLELQITDSDYHHDGTHSAETIPSQTSNPQKCRAYKSSNCFMCEKSLKRS